MQVIGPPYCGGFGGSLALADLDEDGCDDLIVGDFLSQPATQIWAGEVGVLYGRTDPPANWVVDWRVESPPLRIYEDIYYLQLGAALGVGDFDGDGHPDLAIGTDSYLDPGAIYLLRGPFPAPASPAVRDLATEPAEWLLPTPGGAMDGFGTTFALADLDGDGRDDLAAGAPDQTNDDLQGAAYVYFGRALAATAGNLSPDVSILSGDADRFVRLGASLALGDYTGDGLPDLLVADPFFVHEEKHTGRLFLLDGTRLEPGASFALPQGAADWTLTGVGDWWYVFDRFAVTHTVGAAAGPTLLVGATKATWDEMRYTGVVLRVDRDRVAGLGPDVLLADVEPNAIYYGARAYFYLGNSITPADLTGNGIPDLVLGASGSLTGDDLGGVVAVYPDHLNDVIPDDDDDDDNDDDNNDNDNDDNDNNDNDNDTAPGDDDTAPETDDDSAPAPGDDDSPAGGSNDDDDDEGGCGC